MLGAISGALGGFIFGNAFDQAGCNDNGSGSKSICPNSAALTLGLVGGALLGLIGVVAGSAVEHRTTFTLQ